MSIQNDDNRDVPLPGVWHGLSHRSADLAVRLRQPSEPRTRTGASPHRYRRHRRLVVALPRGLGAERPTADHAGRRMDIAGAPDLGWRPGAVQARIADADRLVQGSRPPGHAEPSA